uniref:Uncharacterized protein n=1 Tax=Lepeophtheirus salmonis TaxID=72036 RepID=A0A0K2T3I8_LEPSM
MIFRPKLNTSSTYTTHTFIRPLEITCFTLRILVSSDYVFPSASTLKSHTYIYFQQKFNHRWFFFAALQPSQ